MWGGEKEDWIKERERATEIKKMRERQREMKCKNEDKRKIMRYMNRIFEQMIKNYKNTKGDNRNK